MTWSNRTSNVFKPFFFSKKKWMNRELLPSCKVPPTPKNSRSVFSLYVPKINGEVSGATDFFRVLPHKTVGSSWSWVSLPASWLKTQLVLHGEFLYRSSLEYPSFASTEYPRTQIDPVFLETTEASPQSTHQTLHDYACKLSENLIKVSTLQFSFLAED